MASLNTVEGEHENKMTVELATFPEPTFTVRHYSPKQISELWGLSVDTVRKLFEREAGVLVNGNPSPRRGRRSYTTLRIPKHVAERVYRRNLTQTEFDRRAAYR